MKIKYRYPLPLKLRIKIAIYKYLVIRPWRWWNETGSRYMPKIRRRLPPRPSRYCHICGQPLSRLVALETGAGWAFAWDCPNDCGWEDPVEWHPFLFGAWATTDDLKRLGIEII